MSDNVRKELIEVIGSVEVKDSDGKQYLRKLLDGSEIESIAAAILERWCFREHFYCEYIPSAYDKLHECLCEGRHYPDRCIHCGQSKPEVKE